MGRGLYPYVVDLESLARLPEPDTDAFRALVRRMKKRLAELDASFAEEIADGEVETGAAVLAKIARGKLAPNEDHHGYVIEALAATLGRKLANPVWEKFSVSFFSDLDDELTARGLKGKDEMVSIVQSGIPIGKKKLRAPECGSMTAAQAARVAAKIEAMDLSALSADQKKGALEWLSWMKAAVKRDAALVIFGY